jgi:hypothetical protein
MWQVIEMTHSQKVEMYQTVKKDELIEMLIEANNVIKRLTEVKNASNVDYLLSCRHNYIQKDTYWKSCTHCGMIAPLHQ